MAASTTRRSSRAPDFDGSAAAETERCRDQPDRRASLLETSGANKALRPVSGSRRPISPPPLRRPSGGVARQSEPAGFASTKPSPAAAAAAMLGSARVEAQSPASGLMSGSGSPPPPSLPLLVSDSWPSRTVHSGSPAVQADSSAEWTIPEIAEQLNHFRQEVKDGHSQLTAYIIESTAAPERRVQHGSDLFAHVKTAPVPKKKGVTMKIKSKQHLKAKRDHKEEHHNVHCIKTNKDRVPRYRFHHVGIKKNILTPNTMLTFVPHLRDLESSEETKYNLWLKELEDIDLKSGFKPMNREEKQASTFHLERAATISLYLETWLDYFVIPGCNKSLISYMASREREDASVSQQRTDIIRSQGEADSATLDSSTAAQMFADAFQLVFKNRLPPGKQVDLRRVLSLDESAESIMDAKLTTKDGTGTQNHDEDELAESNLATYCILGCLICFSHSCDHGEYDNKNLKRTFSISSFSHLSDALKRRRAGATTAPSWPPCLRKCYRRGFGPGPQARPWSEDEEIVLRSLFTTATHSAYGGDAICLAANFLDRPCGEAYSKFQSLRLSLPQRLVEEPSRVKNTSWFDRHKKVLLGDWQDHTVSHEHQRRETLEPCSHEGRCVPRVCPCVDAGLLCDKFCKCSVENCAYKFTGCACHSLGRTCQQRQKDKPCICVQLNRECDPQLCGTCGAFERADPLNADDERLHATGCQNCDLQRGVGKSLILGQSQLEGVGYGLFTAEDINQDDFIVEYVGELITHDEGVRREARRGDVFDEHSNISYVFTLLENEGIWVDAAIYGNLSRYINHASENDKRGCNITPRILYVNGEYRIKFTAMRDIQAGEELFFNYGENFPNLTKKLLDHKAGEQPVKAKAGRPRRAEVGDQVARKAPRSEQKRGPGRRGNKRDAATDEDSQTVESPEQPPQVRKRKRRLQDDSAEAEYQPPVTDDTSKAAGAAVAVEDQSPESMTRLRKRTRGALGSSLLATEPQNAESPKKKGKRGGARPGSGRPRKHPRPPPKSAPPPEIKEQDAEQEAPTSSAPPPEPEPERVIKAELMESEIQDSEDGSTVGLHDVPVHGSVNEGAGGGNDADDDGDQDVVVRQRRARAVRNRRPSAKIRYEELGCHPS